ncbi:hypothetical protein B0H66DRAFT_469595 [Apodospora peruviana]|uniref:Uncharacterized protein n=1 Tax=Apodospora peruviana TaxID=516989 RepID=A0AAE0IU50_9PEZI|nr:hypothetical protein B0H66DRAFT_469595 [Apodospora peruviana]
MPARSPSPRKAPALCFINELWMPDKTLVNHDAYYEYFNDQWSLIAGYSNGQYVATQSVQEYIRLAKEIRDGKTFEEMMGDMMQHGVTYEACRQSINLTLRLLLMMRFGAVKGEINPQRKLAWACDGSLQAYVKRHFTQPQLLSCSRLRLPKSFNAWSLETIGAIEVCFTDNLADHLYVEDYSKVFVFRHASFLEYNRNSPVFPEGFIDETLRTLALLFPHSLFSENPTISNNTNGYTWFKKLCSRHHETIDPQLNKCKLEAGERQIECFTFWRDRLIILKEAYDDATPGTLNQWWHDRRNGVQWCTFWVAFTVAIFTILTGFAQLGIAAKQLELQQHQLDKGCS